MSKKERPCKGDPCRRQHPHCPICGGRLFGNQTQKDHDSKCIHANKILPGLYVGAQSNAKCEQELSVKDIRFVLCMASELGTPSKLQLASPGITWKTIPLYDEADEWALRQLVEAIGLLLPYVVPSADAIVSVRGNVLIGNAMVHCHAGKSRSVIVAAGVTMVVHGMSAAKALAYLKVRRPIADPNKGYRHQLDALEILLLAPFSLQTIGLIAEYAH